MAVAASKVIVADTNDVFTGTTVGVLPARAPSYDVEVRVAAVRGSAETLDGKTAGLSLRSGGVQIMNNARAASSLEDSEPNSDGPGAFFNVPGGSRITLNVDVSTASRVVCYCEARENPNASGAAIGVGDMQYRTVTAGWQDLDVLKGTPAGQVPETASLWSLQVQAMKIVSSTASGVIASSVNQDGRLTLLIDSDTVAENFVIPMVASSRATALEWPNDDRDTLITTLVSGGSDITLNLYNTTVGSGASRVGTDGILYRVFLNPVG